MRGNGAGGRRQRVQAWVRAARVLRACEGARAPPQPRAQLAGGAGGRHAPHGAQRPPRAAVRARRGRVGPRRAARAHHQHRDAGALAEVVVARATAVGAIVGPQALGRRVRGHGRRGRRDGPRARARDAAGHRASAQISSCGEGAHHGARRARTACSAPVEAPQPASSGRGAWRAGGRPGMARGPPARAPGEATESPKGLSKPPSRRSSQTCPESFGNYPSSAFAATPFRRRSRNFHRYAPAYDN